ncbi:MAG: ribosomal-protein-alanine N-acetyltransferase [Alphaproteobacteria bacterium]|nr:ribosomal-protein-alanine N-acetyltransferase [Alphaproteobacteria bacterium]MDB5739877.1 ribosomal-protein-alanine N-acetyltransferase [Alphaproteobacteria bacterium]
MTVTEFTGDTAPLAALHVQCFPDAWDAAAIAALLATPGTFAFHSHDGFVLARAVAGEAEILTLAVAPAARGRGLGRALLEAATTKAKALGAETMFLEVGADNPAALALYAGLGFAKIGDRKAYYNGRDAFVLRLPLTGEFA